MTARWLGRPPTAEGEPVPGPTGADLRLAASQALAEPDEERECRRCRATMAGPDASEGGEASPLCGRCAWRVLEMLAEAVLGRADDLPAEATEPYVADELRYLFDVERVERAADATFTLSGPGAPTGRQLLHVPRERMLAIVQARWGTVSAPTNYLQWRLVSAWQASDWDLGRLAATAVAYAGRRLGLVSDEELVELVERWVREHSRGEGR